MRHAILIHAHHLPEQFGRLCGALSHPDFDIYANIDAKANIDDFRAVAPQVNFIEKRIDIRWGRWSQVEATINSLRKIMAAGKDYGYILFISGQDYPVRPLAEIGKFLENNYGSQYIGISSNSLSKKELRRVEMRYTKRWVFLKPKILSLIVNRMLRLLPDKKQYFPVRKGSQWWNLTGDGVRYVLDFCEANPSIVRSYHHSACPDEMFFQSLLDASPLRDYLVDKIFRYVDWSEADDNPKTLTVGDFDNITASGAWFARKVDIRNGLKLMDILDEHIKRGNTVI